MKYVILTPKPDVADLTRVLCCCAPTTHEELAQAFAATHQPTSAGFFDFHPTGTIEPFGFSTSLRMGPAPGDGRLLAGLIRGTAAMGRATRVL